MSEERLVRFYELKVESYGLTPGIVDGRHFFLVRKRLLKVTTIKWAVLETIYDPQYIDGYYQRKTPILLFLN
jgi:hypothetical protein